MAWIAWLPPLRGIIGVGLYAILIVDLLKFYSLAIVCGYRQPQQQQEQQELQQQQRGQRRSGWLRSNDHKIHNSGSDPDVGILLHVVRWMWASLSTIFSMVLVCVPSHDD